MIRQRDFNVLLNGLYSFHFFILTGTLLHNQIPMLITFFKEIFITWQNMSIHFFPCIIIMYIRILLH